jgi:hypothetical protein
VLVHITSNICNPREKKDLKHTTLCYQTSPKNITNLTMSIVDEDNSDIEVEIERGMVAAAAEDIPAAMPSKKEVKQRAPRKTPLTKGIIQKTENAKKKSCNPRPPPRPHKRMCALKLTTTIQQLQHKREEIESHLQVNGIRLRKLMMEETMRATPS